MSDKKLLSELIAKFGNNKVKSHRYSLNVTEEILSFIFDTANKVVFSEMLKPIQIKLEIKTPKIPGKAKFCFNKDTGQMFIAFYKRQSGDNFLKVVNAFCHEMIHYYDFCFGRWSKQIDKYHLTTDFKKLEQYVGRYNIHGEYFMSWVREFRKNGIVVEKYYTENMAKIMFFENEGSDKENNQPQEQSEEDKELERIIYNSIETDGFKAITVENGSIYVVVD